MSESLTSPRRIHAVEKSREALQLRKAGATYQQIADKVGYKQATTAHKAVMKALRELPRDDAREVLDLEVQRLDALVMAMWPKAMRGDTRAADTMIRVMERRSRLLGLDAPAKVQHGADDGVSMIGELMGAIRDAAAVDLDSGG